jgi:superfamily II DNA/RNA helicase
MASNTSHGHEWRRQHQVTCSPGTIDPVVSFQEFRTVFGDVLCSKIEKKGFTSPTLVQSQTLPVALAGMDALVTASTGSGKTLAYVWPMVVHIVHQVPLYKDETGPMAIVLVPTRELALQVHKHVKGMLSTDYTSLAITGGTSNYHLLHDLRKGGGCHAVVATPGRFLDLLAKKKGLSLGRITFCVLDECDKMLDMGFESQVTEILKSVRPDRQSLLLSATMGCKVKCIAIHWLNDPVWYKLQH